MFIVPLREISAVSIEDLAKVVSEYLIQILQIHIVQAEETDFAPGLLKVLLGHSLLPGALE